MSRKILGRSRVFLWLVVVVCLIFGGGCHFHKRRVSDSKPLLPGIEKIVVVGFRAAMPRGDGSDVVQDPLSGAIFMGGPVPRNVVKKMTNLLFDRLVADKRCELVSPGQAEGVYSSIVDSDVNVGMGAVEILQKVGKTFGADAVLAGYIYRWRERKGTDYAVDRAASVAFDLHLVRPTDGAVLWRSKFDKTQRSLSENLFDLETFVQGGGRWMTVEKLAMLGLQKLLEEMPAGVRASGS